MEKIYCDICFKVSIDNINHRETSDQRITKFETLKAKEYCGLVFIKLEKDEDHEISNNEVFEERLMA